MIKRYFSKYTGQQIDEAVRALIENDIQESDLSESLINAIKQWIAAALENYASKIYVDEQIGIIQAALEDI